MNLVVGFVVSALVIYAFRAMFFQPRSFHKIAVAVKLALVFARELIKANLSVLKIVLSREIRVRSGVIALPTELHHDIALTALANMITLTPGTLTLDISPDKRCLFIHTLDLEDPEEVKQAIQMAFERYLRELSR